MLNTVLHIVNIIFIIVNIFLLLCVLCFSKDEKSKKRKICLLVEQYNKKMDQFKWYYDGNDEYKGLKELANVYYNLQKQFGSLQFVYKEFITKFFKIVGGKGFKQVETINVFRGIDDSIADKGFFLKIRQKKRLQKTKTIISNNDVGDGKKQVVLDMPRLGILSLMTRGILIIAIGFVVAYIIQFIWIDGVYADAVKIFFLKTAFFLALVLPIIAVLLSLIYTRDPEVLIEMLIPWVIWALVSLTGSFLVILVIYTIKDLPYAVSLAKRVMYPSLYFAVFGSYVLNKLLIGFSERHRVLERLLNDAETDLKDVSKEEYETQLSDNLEILNNYVCSCLAPQLNDDCSSVPKRMGEILYKPEYQVRAKKMNSEMKREIADVFSDYQCLETLLSKPFIINGKVDIKGMKDNYDRFCKVFGEEN